MPTTHLADHDAEELADVLARVAAHSGTTSHLHEILGGFCHQFRNHLNGLKMSLYLARRGAAPAAQPAWDVVETRYQGVEHYIDRLQLVCRPMTLALVTLPLDLLFEDRKAVWTQTLAARGKGLIVEPPAEPAVGRFDPNRLGLCFDSVVSWRARAGRPGSDVRVSWSAGGSEIRVAWDEPVRADAAGPPGDEPEPFEALTIPLMSRIVSLHGGSLEVARSDEWRVVLRWPIDARSTPREAPRC